jgi:DNA-binding protein HU-beta
MTKSELISAVARDCELEYAQAKRLVDAMLECITAEVAQGHNVGLAGFGCFKRVHRAGRTARSPRSGALFEIAPTFCAQFVPWEHFKAAVAGQRRIGAAPNKRARPAVGGPAPWWGGALPSVR